jgi:hypothetical protein
MGAAEGVMAARTFLDVGPTSEGTYA